MKKMKTNYILKGLFVFFLGVNWVLGQRTETGSPYLPNIVPPSPNATSLGKFGDIPVGYYSGIPNINIPIYNISSRGLNHSISLSYHSNGLKVEEVSSNVGLGWSLNAGGVITRTVRGLPDDLPTVGYYNNNVNYNASETELCTYFVEQRQNRLDLHPDTYFFNAGGISGKFLVQKDASGKRIGYTLNSEGNFKIEWISEFSWKITDSNGTEYYFGTSSDGLNKAIDKTTTTPKNTSSSPILHTSAWYLMDIIAHNGESIMFKYDSFENTSCQRGGQTTYFKYFSSGDGCDPLPNALSLNESITLGSRIKEIIFLNGKVKFNYSNIERADFKGDFPLENVKIYSSTNVNDPIKVFKLNQSYFGSDTSTNQRCGDGNEIGKRLKLLNVTECDKDDKCMPSYEFTYYETSSSSPDRFSFAQDHWGYYNGQLGNTTLIPAFVFQVPNGNKIILPGSNRTPDITGNAQKLHTLKDIKYPTGGFSIFEYEPNTSQISDWGWETLPRNIKLASITGRQYIDNGNQPVTVTFEITKKNVYNIAINTGVLCDNRNRTGGCGVELNLQGPVNIPLDGFYTNSNGVFSTNEELLPGTYVLTLGFIPTIATPSMISVFGCSIWGPEQTSVIYNKIVGGIRIKSTINKSCGTCQEEKMNFSYNDELGKSSGNLVSEPKYDYIIEQTGSVSGGQGGCLNLVRTSFSQIPLGITQGSHIGYRRVEISRGIDSEKSGKTVNTYTTSSDFPDIGSNSFPFAPQTTMDWKRGILTKSEDYRFNGTVYKLTKKIENIYNYADSRYGRLISGLQISKTIVGTEDLSNPACAKLISQKYNTQAGWLHLDRQKISIFDINENENETITNYEYNNGITNSVKFFQPTKTIENDSKNQQISTLFKYSYDFPDATNQGMVLKNIISNPIEKTTNILKIGSTFPTQLSYEKTTYDLFSNKFYLPKKIETQHGSGPLTNAITFDSYDANGNLLQYTPKNGLKTNLTYFGLTDIGMVNLLKSQTNNAGHTTLYDHYPLIGLKSITDPNGKITTYNYDSFNRLSSISDQDGILKSYAYNYGSNPDTKIPLIEAYTYSTPEAQECKMCCLAEADASSNSPIINCTSGQISLSSGTSSTGADVKYAWTGPNNFTSTVQNPIITGDLTKAGGVYTLTVTKLNSTCEATATATTNVVLDCICPFSINTNGTTPGPLSCQQTISLVGNCVGCSTGDPAPGTENYVVNGKFDGGFPWDPLFSSDCGGGFLTNNPNSLTGTFNSFGDHTTGNGTMFLTGESNNTNERVWYQTITVKPNTRYVISAWITSAYNNNPTKVNWEVNGLILPEQVDMTNKTGGQWMQLKSSWLSGNQTSIVLAIRKQNIRGHNWFAFDDISFTEVKPAAKYSWSGPDNFVSTSQKPFIRNVGLKNSGTYTLAVVDNGCTKISTVNVTVNCQPCLEVNPLTVYLNTNTPVSCGSQITLTASANKSGVTYTWYRINPDDTDLLLPSTNNTDKTLNITAPSVPGLTRYGYMVAAFKNGCNASYTSPVEVKCVQDGDVDLALNLRIESGETSVTAGKVFAICADMTNQSTTRNAGSVRASVLLPDCLEYVGDPWGLNTGPHPDAPNFYYENIWFNGANREVTNLSTSVNRGGNAWQFWGVPIGANQTRSMCFKVKALTSSTIIVKGQIAVIETTSYQNMKDSDSEPNNGYDNGEDDRSALIVNPSSNTLDLSTFQLRTSFAANSNEVDVISGNANWTAAISDPWISLNKISGGNGTTTVTITLSNNVNAKTRFGFVTFSSGCGLSRVLKIKQAGKDDCPTIDISSNNPYCGDQLKLFANIVPSVNKDLVSNGNFEKGDVDFNPESYHYYSWQTGGSLADVVSSNPRTENGNIGMWFINKECPGENTNLNCKVVNRVRLLFRNDCCLDRLNGARIQGSNNKSQWNDLYSFGNATGAWQDVSFNKATNYMYVRFVAGSNGYGELREIEFYNGTTKLTGQLFGAPGILGGNGVANATDGLETTFWHSTGVGEEAYVGLELLGCSLAGNVASSVSGTGKQMAVAASWRLRDAFWSQTILVDPYTDYNISVKAVQLGNYDNVPLKLIFDVDGVPIKIDGYISTTGCTWQKIGGIWNSGEKFGPVKLTLRFENPNSNNKFFAIDDISVKPNVSGTASNSPITYSWIAPNKISQDSLKSANIANPVINKLKGINAGIYTLSVVQNGCPVTETIDVNIACSSVTCPAPTLQSPYARVCSNMGQTATINAFGCPVGSTVRWSDGQVSALLPFSTDPATGKITYISTIKTAKIQQGTNYSAQCQTDCGLSNKSLDLFVHAVAVPNPPLISPAGPIIEKLPGADGTIMYASGCNDGIIKWSNGTTGVSTWIPTLGFRTGDYVEVTAVCKTECAESSVSNKVKIIVICPVQNPSYASVISAPSCTSSGGNAELESSCPVGTVVWSKDSDPSFVMTGNRITTWVNANTRFKVRCDYSQYCVSDRLNLDVTIGGKPNKPTITSEPSNAENPLILKVGMNSTVLLTANGCPSRSTVNWSFTGYSSATAVGSSVSITPTVSGTITAIASCSEGTCSSDPSDTFTISTLGTTCGNLSLNVSPGTNPIEITKNSSLALNASGCFDGTNYGVVRWYLGSTKLSEKNMSSTATPLTVNVNSSTCGTYFYYATCKIGSCEAIVNKTINVICGCTKAPITLSLNKGTEKCGETEIIASSSNANVTYQWFYRANASAPTSSLSNTSSNFLANIDGDYLVKVIDKDDSDCFSTSQWISLGIKKSINSAPRAYANTTIYPGGAATLKADGCSAGTTYVWSDGLNTGTPISVSPSSTTNYRVKCRETNGTATCESANSGDVTVTVICGSSAPSLEYDSPTSKVCPGVNISIKASACSGTVKWYESSDDVNFTFKASGAFYTTNKAKIWASCTASGSTCESAKTGIETQIDFGRIDIMPNCDYTVLTASPNDPTNYAYKWQKGGNPPNAGSATLAINEKATYVLYVKRNGTACEKTTAYTPEVTKNKKPSVSLSQAPTGCGNVNLTATVGNTSLAFPPYTYKLIKDMVFVESATENTSTTHPFTISEGGNYTVEVTSVDGCSGSASTNISIENIPVPSFTTSANCYTTGGASVTLTANGCPNAYLWESGQTTNVISISPSMTTQYKVKCVTASNCSGSYSTPKTITLCPPPLPTICNGTTITQASGGASGYSNTFDYSGGITGKMSVFFETFCIPDKLIISKKSINATTYTAVYTGDCMGSGKLATSPPGVYCNNLVNSGGNSFQFDVTKGDVIKVEVTPTCADSRCYQCPTGTSEWRLQFTCPSAN